MAPLNRLWLAGFMTGITTNHKRCTYNKNTTWKLNIFFKRDWNCNHRNSSKKKYILNLKFFSFVSEMYKEKLRSQLILKSNIQSYNFFSPKYMTHVQDISSKNQYWRHFDSLTYKQRGLFRRVSIYYAKDCTWRFCTQSVHNSITFCIS